MKFVLFVFVALFACAFAYQCQSSTCVQTGGSCQYTDTAAPVCGYGSFCSSSDVCTAELAAGAACTDSNQCISFYYIFIFIYNIFNYNYYYCILYNLFDITHSAGYDCEGNVCVMTRVGPGAPCSANGQCYTNNGSSSSCVSGQCAYTAAGGICDTENDNCGRDANIGYCKSADSVNTTGICTNFVADSGACDDVLNLCNAYSSCINGTCIHFGTAAQGALCKSTQDCADGLVCTNGGSSTCQLPNTTATSTSGQTCSFSSDCGTFEECSCSGVSDSTCQFLTANNAGVTAASVAYFKCKAESSYACYLDLPSCEVCDVQLCSFINSQNLTGSSLSFATCSVSPRVASLYSSKCVSNSSTTTSTSSTSTSSSTTTISTTTSTSASSSVVVSLSVLLVFVACTLF